MKLTNEQIKKLSTFKSSQEVMEYLESEGVELSAEDLEGIAGGNGWGTSPTCPKCGASKGIFDAYCNSCGWKVRAVEKSLRRRALPPSSGTRSIAELASLARGAGEAEAIPA